VPIDLGELDAFSFHGIVVAAYEVRGNWAWFAVEHTADRIVC
jgi:hypothetical protein